MRHLNLLLVLLALSLAHTIGAENRIQIRLRHDGVTVPGGEVCFYPYQMMQPLSGLAAREYRCLPADRKLSLPLDSEFAFFLRTEAGLVSSNPIVLQTSTAHDDLRSFVFDVEAGGTLDISPLLASLEPEEHLAFVLGGGPRSGPFTMPAIEARTVVPANIPIVPVRLLGQSLTAVGATIRVAPGETKVIESLPPSNALLLRCLPLDTETGALPPATGPLCDQKYSGEASELLFPQVPPVIRLIDSAGSVHVPEAVPSMTSHLMTNLLVFTKVPEGRAILRIEGNRWIATEYQIDVQTGVRVLPDPFAVRLGGDAEVRLGDVVGELLDGNSRDCSNSGGEAKLQSRIVLFKCPPRSAAAEPVAGCVEIETRDYEAKPMLAFEGLEPGRYRALASVGNLIVADETFEVRVGRTTSCVLADPRIPYIRGMVTQDGLPLDGSIQIMASRTRTAENGSFALPLQRSGQRVMVYFTSCDEATYYGFRPDTELVSGSILNIAVPSGIVEISLVDADSGESVKGADTILGVLRDEEDPEAVLYLAPGRPVGEKYVVPNLQEGIPYRVCAEMRGYKRRCSDEVQVKKAGRESVSMKLVRLAQSKGQVLARGYTNLFWTLPDGTVTETVRIEPDGSFYYEASHPSGEAVVLVGDAPLFVTSSPVPSKDGQVEIPVVIHSTTDVRVRLSDASTRRNALVGVWANGVRVPNQALFTHQIRRKRPALILDRATVVIPDLAASSLVVAAGPDPSVLPPGSDFGSASLFIGAVKKPVAQPETVLD